MIAVFLRQHALCFDLKDVVRSSYIRKGSYDGLYRETDLLLGCRSILLLYRDIEGRMIFEGIGSLAV